MKKARTSVYRCTLCGHQEPKWLGRCPKCGQWNSLKESAGSLTGTRSAGNAPTEVASLPLAMVDPQQGTRLSTGINELDRVLGGGAMKKSAILVGGEPGIGKSTLLLQAAAGCPSQGRVLYVSGEESAGQLRLRADRLGLDLVKIEVLCAGRLETIEKALDAVKPSLVIIDSVQTLHSPEIGPAPGTINQMKYCCYELVSWVKAREAVLFLVAHVTKEGQIAGPKNLEHLVDTVLYFEQNDADSRFLRATKNRFGSVDEIGIFTMGERGLKPVDDPSSLFLVRRDDGLPAGIATAAVLEGTRPLLVEIQALTVPSKASVSRVYSDKIDSARVARTAAVLERHLGLRLSDHDLYINVAGGIRIMEVGVDLALAAALYSARTGLPLPLRTAVAGELSLAAEVRPIRRPAARAKTAMNLGYQRFVGPRSDRGETEEVHWEGAANLKDFIGLLFGRQ